MRVVVATLLALVLASCIVKRFTSPRLTGTCGGACSHYVECKPAHLDTDRSRCETECPDVFSDRDSLMAYESLSCSDAVEYVDGSQTRSSRR